MQKSCKSCILSFGGHDGASFFLSCRSFRDWRISLEFYRGVGGRAKLKKALCLFLYPWAKLAANLNGSGVCQEISTVLHVPPPDIVPDDIPISALISMTRDKAVIHFHGRGYLKIASGNSLPEVTEELSVYQLLVQKRPRTFDFSSCEQIVRHPESVSFFMDYAPGCHYSNRHPEIAELTDVLHEFFALTASPEGRWEELWRQLDVAEANEVLPAEFQDGTTPLGMVHRDFKPWNVKSGEKPLIYDFESVSFSGCPLEDFFNYIVDPFLHQTSPAKVLHGIRRRYWEMASAFLTDMGISPSEVQRYWCWYLTERIAFWRKHKQPGFAEKFVELLKLSCH